MAWRMGQKGGCRRPLPLRPLPLRPLPLRLLWTAFPPRQAACSEKRRCGPVVPSITGVCVISGLHPPLLCPPHLEQGNPPQPAGRITQRRTFVVRKHPARSLLPAAQHRR